MAETKHVTEEVFRSALRNQLKLANALMELTFSIRTALIDTGIVTPKQLEDATRKVHNSPQFQKRRQDLANASRSIEDFLRDFEGPVQ
jgi:hypothetical protein